MPMTPLAEPRVPTRRADPTPADLTLADAAALSTADVLERLRSTPDGLSSAEARRRLARVGPNALRSHGARPFAVLLRQLRNPLLVLLVAAALTSFAVGERTSALIILLIICMSVGLGFFNEYRSELAVEALHSQLRHTALVIRDGEPVSGRCHRAGARRRRAPRRRRRRAGRPAAAATPTGWSATSRCSPASRCRRRSTAIRSPRRNRRWPTSRRARFMGTVVRDGQRARRRRRAPAVGPSSARSRSGLGERQPQTAFQLGLRDSRCCSSEVAGVLAGSILVINVALGRPLLDSVLFSLAIAVGITPQLLPGDRHDQPGHRRHGGWPSARCWSSGWSASRISATSTCCSPTRPARSPRARSPSPPLWTRDGEPSDAVLRSGCCATTRPSPAGAWSAATRSTRRSVAGAGRPATGARQRYARLAALPVRPPAPPGLGPRRARRRRSGCSIVKGAPESGARPLRDRPAEGAGRRSTASSPPAAA